MKWYFKQLLPLLYYTKFEREGKKMFSIWRMWFGRCFDIVEVEVK